MSLIESAAHRIDSLVKTLSNDSCTTAADEPCEAVCASAASQEQTGSPTYWFPLGVPPTGFHKTHTGSQKLQSWHPNKTIKPFTTQYTQYTQYILCISHVPPCFLGGFDPQHHHSWDHWRPSGTPTGSEHHRSSWSIRLTPSGKL